MFKLLKLPFKIIILLAALYGVLQIPLSGKPLLKHIQKTVVLQLSKLSENMATLTLTLSPRGRGLRERGIQNDKKRKYRSRAQPGMTEETIKASEEDRLEKILSGKE